MIIMITHFHVINICLGLNQTKYHEVTVLTIVIYHYQKYINNAGSTKNTQSCYGTLKLCYGTYIYENLLVISIFFKNVQSSMTSLFNNLILLFEFIFLRFIANIHIVWKSS